MSRPKVNDHSWADLNRNVTIQTGNTNFSLKGVTSTSTAISEIKRAIDNAHTLETTINPCYQQETKAKVVKSKKRTISK